MDNIANAIRQANDQRYRLNHVVIGWFFSDIRIRMRRIRMILFR